MTPPKNKRKAQSKRKSTPPDKPLTARMKDALKALEDSQGNITLATELHGINRTSHTRWLKESTEYAKAFERISQSLNPEMERMVEALIQTKGNVLTSATQAGIARIQHYDWLNSHTVYFEAVTVALKDIQLLPIHRKLLSVIKTLDSDWQMALSECDIDKKTFNEWMKNNDLFFNEFAGLLDKDHLTPVMRTTLDMLAISNGYIHVAINKLALQGIHITHVMHNQWIEDNPQYAQEVEIIKISKNEGAEIKLLLEGSRGNVHALKTFLEANAKNMGYGKSLGDDNASNFCFITPEMADLMERSKS